MCWGHYRVVEAKSVSSFLRRPSRATPWRSLIAAPRRGTIWMVRCRLPPGGTGQPSLYQFNIQYYYFLFFCLETEIFEQFWPWNQNFDYFFNLKSEQFRPENPKIYYKIKISTNVFILKLKNWKMLSWKPKNQTLNLRKPKFWLFFQSKIWKIYYKIKMSINVLILTLKNWKMLSWKHKNQTFNLTKLRFRRMFLS